MATHQTKKKNTTTLLTVILIVLLLALTAVIVCSCLDNVGSGQGSGASSTSSLFSEEALSSVNPLETSSVSNVVTDIPVSAEMSSETSSVVPPPTSSATSGQTTSSQTSSLTDDPATRNQRTKGTEEFPYYLAVNREQNIVIVYTLDENGYYTIPYKAFVCSCGIPKENGTETTPAGTYNTTDQYTWRYLSGDVYGQYATRITGHILFHSVPYFEKDKATLEWEEYNKLGNDASLGCVRLSVIDAKWIYDNCPKGTIVTIYDSSRVEPFEKPTPIHIDETAPERDWDPTDPDPENPWHTAEDVS